MVNAQRVGTYKAQAEAGDELVFGYRAKREDEKVGGPSDEVLVPYDAELQASFERIVFELFGDKKRPVSK